MVRKICRFYAVQYGRILSMISKDISVKAINHVKTFVDISKKEIIRNHHAFLEIFTFK